MASRGAYNTRQKAQILDFLIEHEQRRLTVDEVVQRLFERGTSVGKTTVYRHLEALTEQGAVHKYAADGITCYQYLSDGEDCKHHSHLVCTGCGDLFHVECGLMKQLSEHMRDEHGFELDDERCVLYGRCEKCARGEGE